MRLAPLLALLILVLAGCFGGSPRAPPDGPTPSPSRPLPILEQDHDHWDADAHQDAHGLAMVGFLDATDLLGDEMARLSDLQFFGNRTAVAVNGRGGTSSGGFLLFDMKGPADWTLLRRYRSGSEDNWYTKFSADGAFVFLTANGNTNANDFQRGLAESLRTATVGGPARGIHIVNVSVPPVGPNGNGPPSGFFPAPIRVVNLATWKYKDGSQWVFASMIGERAGAPEASRLNYVSILRFDTADPIPRLVEMQRWQPAEASTTANAFPHDLAVGIHPFNGRPLLFVAYWDAGAYILDVNTPTTPVQLSRIPPSAPHDHVHTFKPHNLLINDQYYAVVAPETFSGEPAGPYRLFNITDPRQPKMEAVWTPPPDEIRNPTPLMFSPHDFSLSQNRLYASQFHGGIWVLDLPSLTPKAVWAKSVGAPERIGSWAVDVETAVWYRGHVYGVDMGTGILVLRETV